MSITAARITTTNAVSSTITRIGMMSSRPIESAASWPTPWRLKTDSVRIAPPPITCAMSSPHSEMIGIRLLRSMWRDQHLSLGQALRVGRADVVLVDRVEDRRAQHA